MRAYSDVCVSLAYVYTCVYACVYRRMRMHMHQRSCAVAQSCHRVCARMLGSRIGVPPVYSRIRICVFAYHVLAYVSAYLHNNRIRVCAVAYAQRCIRMPTTICVRVCVYVCNCAYAYATVRACMCAALNARTADAGGASMSPGASTQSGDCTSAYACLWACERGVRYVIVFVCMYAGVPILYTRTRVFAYAHAPALLRMCA